MVNKTLVGGIIGFVLGGLVVSTAAIMINKDEPKGTTSISAVEHNQASTDKLKPLKGDKFDKAFLTEMISHHQGAIDMAKLIEANAKHDELKALGQDIISAQTKEIDMMRAWQSQWGYKAAPEAHDMHDM